MEPARPPPEGIKTLSSAAARRRRRRRRANGGEAGVRCVADPGPEPAAVLDRDLDDSQPAFNVDLIVHSLAGNEQFRFEVPAGITAGVVAQRIANSLGTWEGYVQLVANGNVLEASTRLPEPHGDEPEVIVTMVLRGRLEPEERTRFIATMSRDRRKASDVLAQAPARLRADRDVIMEAVRLDRRALSLTHLRTDPEVVMEAVLNDGLALMYASDSLRGDRDIVLQAVKNDARALRWAAEPLTADREIVFKAVQRDGRVLKYAAEVLRADREVVRDAVWQNPWSLRFASADLRTDVALHAEVLEYHPIDGALAVSQVLREFQASSAASESWGWQH